MLLFILTCNSAVGVAAWRPFQVARDSGYTNSIISTVYLFIVSVLFELVSVMTNKQLIGRRVK